MSEKKKPTIDELERLLHAEDKKVTLQPNGEVRVGESVELLDTEGNPLLGRPSGPTYY